jgi:hypothetical protein
MWADSHHNTPSPTNRITTGVYSCKYHVVWCPKYRPLVLVKGKRNRLSSLPLPDAFKAPKGTRIHVPGIGWTRPTTFAYLCRMVPAWEQSSRD